MHNHLYYGDNLSVMRESFADESVDLIYLDPPFNSSADYNILFKSPESTKQSPAQVEAFKDTWHWSEEAETAYDEVMKCSNADVAETLRVMRKLLRENDMMAYLAMMAIRLVELHRILKPSGSLYLHCDPTASHYLKLLLDAAFGKENYRNEISWKRAQPKSHTLNNFSNARDVIFRYSKSDSVIFNKVYTPHDPEYLTKFYRFTDVDGRRYMLDNLANPNKKRPNLTYEFLGVKRVWRWTRERMEKAYADGLIVQSKVGAVPRYKRYLDEMHGTPITNNWDDIQQLHGSAREYLGYPTQKPLALLERIIATSSNAGDVVFDPFCGCGTTIHAAEKLGRQWRGIDITNLAVSLIEKRLYEAFPAVQFTVHGVPQDIDGARALAEKDKYQFQWWAVSLIHAIPYGGKKKGADGGIDGLIFFRPDGKATEKAVVSVKGGNNVNVSMIRDFAHVIEREEAKIGVFITLAPPTDPMLREAVKMGMYETEYGKYPRLQIFSIGELFAGAKPQIPLIDTSSFRTAAREVKDTQGTFEL
jgi:site-specific DNA-methyltransferase (adenine-specific)